MADDVVVIGLDQLDATIQRLVNNVTRQGLRKAVSDGAEVFRREVRARAPVRQEGDDRIAVTRRKGQRVEVKRPKGWLKRHIGKMVMVDESRAEATAMVGPTKSAFYARFDELGTSHQSAHPFLRPSFDSKQGEAIQAFSDTLKKSLEESLP